jgi:hypothetical protein
VFSDKFSTRIKGAKLSIHIGGIFKNERRTDQNENGILEEHCEPMLGKPHGRFPYCKLSGRRFILVPYIFHKLMI